MRVRRVGLLCGLALSLAISGPATAAPIFFGFELDFTAGPLAGQTFSGTVSVDGDDCTAAGGLCDGVFFPNSLDHTLLSFDVTVDGVPFGITDDAGYPNFPLIEFDNDEIVFVDFAALVDFDLLTIAGSTVNFHPADADTSVGVFVGGGRIEQVPAPAGLALLAVGAAAIGVMAVRRRRPHGPRAPGTADLG